MTKNVLAFDLGASSGRVILGTYKDNKIVTEEIHRFTNAVIEKEGSLFWDLDYLFSEILLGLKKATEKYQIDSIGFDTWGVDFVCLDENGQALQNAVSYRDQRTKGLFELVAKDSAEKLSLFQATGNQPLEINTLFQLLTFREQEPDLFKKTQTILNMPDWFNYHLTGEKKAERSIASTTQLMSSDRRSWNEKLLEKFDLSPEIFPELVHEGNHLGHIKAEFVNQKIKVINVCEHDTASAVVCIPTVENDFLFISSGTWSLIGTELSEANLSKQAYDFGLSNESGQGRTSELLKNCTGLWIIQELQKDFASLGQHFDFTQISEMASQAPAFQTLINTEDSRFSSPGQMVSKIKDFAKESNQKVPQAPAEFFRSVYESLALQYREAIGQISEVTGRSYETIYIIGGGSQASFFCQMISNATNKTVCAGPAEATALGNIAIQLKTQGIFKDIKEIRASVRDNEPLKLYKPEKHEDWEQVAQFIKKGKTNEKLS